MKFNYADLLGKEFKYGGRGPDAFDCYGLMIECRGRAGLFMPEGYASTDLPEVMHDSIDHARANYPFGLLAGPQPFCLVTFKLHPKYTTHIGMVLPDGTNVRFIHILPKMRVGVERLDNAAWRHRITGFWETRSRMELSK
ncbi:MAG: C40 family peptidase [Desulfobacteraceae bacterium]|nr:C40 family peptidase [Desulfobacteraceae bacterium]